MNENFFTKLSDLVNGWGYSENEARELLQEDGEAYGYPMHDFEVIS